MPTISDAVGRVLGKRYRLVAALGAGASAHVYLAEDVTLQRQVAVKLLLPGLAGDQAFLKRFRAEARTVASLNHPHVLRVFDWGEDADEPYLILEYLDGGSLRDLLDRGVRLDHAQATRLGAEAAAGLAYAHARGLVHRDIKPANLLFDEEQRLRVGDFGVARALAEAAWTEPVGAMVGTARYASPEQAQGRTLDGRSDVYSLALVLYEALTGEVPFTADTTTATLMARLDAPLPHHRALGPLDDILRRSADPDSEQRYDAGQLTAVLEALSTTLPAPRPLPTTGPAGAAAASRGPTATRDALAAFAGPAAREVTDVAPVADPAAAAGAAAGAAAAAAVGEATPAAAVAAHDATAALPAQSAQPTPDLRSGPDEVFDLEAIEAREASAKSPPLAPAATGVLPASAAAAPPAAGRATTTDTPPVTSAVPVASSRAVGPATAAVPVVAATPAANGTAAGGPRRQSPPPAIAQRTRRHRRWPWITATVVAVAALLAAGAIYAVEAKVFTPSVKVQNLVGATLSVARQTAGAQHLSVQTAAPVFSTTAADGVVVSQQPSPGTSVKQGSIVHLVISKGPPPEAVPSLSGVDCATAQRLLSLAHLTGVCPAGAQQYSATVASGQVISWSQGSATNPTRALFGSAITIVVSKGHAPVAVPQDLLGDSYSAASSALSNLGFQVTQASATSTQYPAGQVSGLNPAGGQTVTYGSTVTVTVSSGPPTVAVPDVTGDDVDQATSALSAAGLTVGGVYGPGNGHGTVVATDPTAGQTVDVGSSVDLYVA